MAYYASCLLVGQLESGGNYHDLRPSIGICLLDAIEFREEEALHHSFQLRTEGGLLLTDCLRIHLFELPKYVPPSDNRVIDDPIEQWLYFFCRADESTAEELTARLPDPVFAEATGVLEMIARDPDQRSLYEARLKAERDARAKLDYARQEGHQKGEAVGEVRGKVKILRDLLHEASPTDPELQTYTLDQLATLESDLQRRLREPG